MLIKNVISTKYKKMTSFGNPIFFIVMNNG